MADHPSDAPAGMGAEPRLYCHFVDGDAEIDALLRSLCAIGGRVATLTRRQMRIRGFPETRTRAEAALRTAKAPPRGAVPRWLKRVHYGWQYNAFRHWFAQNDAVAVCWSGLRATRRVFMDAARDAGRPTIFMERAPLPGRVTVDPQGVNQASSLPRCPGFYLDWARDVPQAALQDWRRLRAQLQARRSTRADVGQDAGHQGAADPRLDAPFVFCPLQVPDDVQITQFSGWAGSLDGFLEALAQAAARLPEGWHLRVKEHPSARVSLRARLDPMAARLGPRLVVDNRSDTFEQVERARAVVTLNSSVGLQAFFFDKPVLVLGEALFRIERVATPVASADDLAARFAAIETAGFDPAARAAFMAYLDRVYYPEITRDPKGRPAVAPELVRPKLP